MADIATLTKNAHDTGFEKGSTITIQTILNYLDNNGGSVFANAIANASNDGTLNKYRPDALVIEPIENKQETNPVINPNPTELGGKQMSLEEARGKGFTGSMCSNCGSMEMQIAGHCEVCASCGTTTGCS